jgi:aryl-alcohol dehydrogenase-like predicted oxidoreductase
MLTRDPEVVRYAVEKGVDFVDTADCYMGGENERIVGRALSGGLRKKVVLATKVHVSDVATMVRSVENSLRSLQTDAVDLMQLHGISTEAEVLNGPAREALERLVKEGKVRFPGVTTHSGQEEVLAAVAKHGFYRTVLVSYNFRSPGSLSKAIRDASAAGVGIIAMKTQAGGYPTAAGSPLSPHQAALAWVLKGGDVATTIPSMTAFSHVDDNLGARGKGFSWLDRRTLAAWEEEMGHLHCSLCGACGTVCRKGVDVPSVLRCLTYREGYGEEALARGNYGALPPSRTAAACASCDRCTVKCRLGLDVAALAARAHALLG